MESLASLLLQVDHMNQLSFSFLLRLNDVQLRRKKECACCEDVLILLNAGVQVLGSMVPRLLRLLRLCRLCRRY